MRVAGIGECLLQVANFSSSWQLAEHLPVFMTVGAILGDIEH
jgi:hypothetical protein